MKRAPARQTSKHGKVLIISYQGFELAGLNTTIDLSTANSVDLSWGRLPPARSGFSPRLPPFPLK